MRQDNYYVILGVPFHASTLEIKKAYRKKALLLHPDKNNDDPIKAAKFQLVQKAYSTLSNSAKRAEYNRTIWVDQSKQVTNIYTTPEELINAVNALNKNLSTQNQFFINRDWLLNECEQLFSGSNQALFNNNPILKKELFDAFAKCLIYLPYSNLKQFEINWLAFAKEDEALLKIIQPYFKKIKRAQLWENNKVLIAVLLGLIITLFIMNG